MTYLLPLTFIPSGPCGPLRPLSPRDYGWRLLNRCPWDCQEKGTCIWFPAGL